MFTNLFFRVTLVSLLASLFITISAQAQFASDYQFSAYQGTYTPLPASSNSVNLVSSGIQAVPLGFNFNFAGTNYTSVSACIHGFLSFDPNAIYSSVNNLATGVQNVGSNVASNRPLVAPLWDGLGSDAPGFHTSYETAGLPGSQVFTFEWANMEWSINLNVPVISFQVKLYEGTNRIEFIYRQESGQQAYTSASIGIAGAATGPGNFLSLNNTSPNPSVSYTTETTTLSTRPATGQVYAFSPPPASPVDVRIIGLAAPATSGCFGANQTVKFTLKNNGSAPLNFASTPVTVSGVVRGPNALSFPPLLVNAGTLAPNATQDVTVSANYNMSAAGNYAFNARASAAGDGNTANDSLLFAVSRTVPPVTGLPKFLDFTGYTGNNLGTVYPGWYMASGTNRQGSGSRWTSFSGLGKPNNITNRMHFPGVSRAEWFISPAFLPVASTVLRFKTAITAISSTNTAATNMAGTDDEVKVMISTDCGLNFNPTQTFNGSNTASFTNVLADQEISLAAYAGQNIILAFYANDGVISDPVSYDFHVDDVFIGTPPAKDLGLIAVTSPAANACFGAAENVGVTIKNYGTSPVNFATTNATVQVNVTGPNPATLLATLSSGTLAPGATQNVSLAPAVNMLTPGVYNFRAFVTLPADADHTNDTVNISRQVGALAALPQTTGFTGFNGTNIATILPGWQEASGPARSGTTSLWRGKTVKAVPGNVSLSIAMGSEFNKSWVISPTIMPVASTVIRFNAAMSLYNTNLNTNYAGMIYTDDTIQVMVSTDCGATFTPIYTFTASNTAQFSSRFTPFSFPLGQYAGQAIIVALYANDGVSDNLNTYDFDIDDLFIGTPPAADLGVTAINTPLATGCYTSAEAVSVTVKNFNTSPLDFSTSNALVTVQVTGPVTSYLSAVINTGVMAPNSTFNVSVSPTVNMQAAGVYRFKAYTSIAGDVQPFNDTAAVVRTRYPLVSTSPTVTFTGYNGNNLTAVFPDWREAYGFPAGSATGPNWGSRIGLGSPTNVTAELYLHDTWQNNWLLGPKFTANANTQLSFDAAITDWPGVGPAAVSMAATDDYVQVLVSTDCGTTYTPVYTFDASTAATLSNTLTHFNIPLGQFAGQQISVAFYGSGGTVDDAAAYGFHLDNIAVNTISGVKETQAGQALSIYPNPNNGTFEIKLAGNTKKAVLTIRNVTGQVLKTEQVNAKNSETVNVNAKGLAPGIYIVELQTEDRVQRSRMVVQ